MRAKMTFPRFCFLIALPAACFAPSPATCQWPSPEAGPRTAPAPAATPAPGQPAGANSEIFKTLRAQCESELACGKGNGDICADAAAILLSDDPPAEFREMNQAQKTKIALRLLERGIDSSNLAIGRAYDLYDKPELLGLFGGYSDPYRANELLDLMIKRSYPGGALRKARSAVSILSLATSDAEKREGCAAAKKFLAGGKLDADSTRIANEVVESSYCKNLVESKN